MSSIVMAAASPGLLNVVMDIKPLDSGIAIVTDLPASDSESAGIYVSNSHVGTETGLHRVTVRQGSKILAAWYVDLTNTGNRDIAYDSDRIINTNTGKVDLNDNQQTVTIGGVFNGVDLLPDQTGATIGTVDNVTNPVTVDTINSGAITAIENGIWDALIANHLDLGSFGIAINNLNTLIDVSISSRADQSSIDNLNDVSLAEIADAVWDELRAGHISAGSFGQFVISQVIAIEDNIITSDTIAPNAIGSDQLAVTAIDEIADGVWNELRAGHTTVGTFGEGVNIPDAEWKRLWEQVTLAEGYATSGVIHSASQIMYLVMSILQNPQYVNFEFKARRLDGITEAAAFQMDDDTNPTQHNRIR